MNRFIKIKAPKPNSTSVKKSKTTAQRRVPATLFVLVLLLYIAHATFGNWTSFRGDPQLTGVSGSQLPDDPQLLWTFQAGDMIESTAAVVDGTVYVGALDGVLYAINAETGEKRWTYQTNSSIKASPAIHNGVVYFGDSDGVFHAVNINTHDIKWQFRTEGEIISSANLAGDRVLFGSYDGFLYCLNSESGELVWKYETEGYVHGTPGIWTQSGVGSFAIVTGCDSYLRVININDGTQTQQVNLGAYVVASPAISQNRVYCGTYGTEILGIALETGEIAWRYRNPKRQYPFFASAAVTNDSIIIGGRDKMVHALSRETGEPIWTYTTKSRIESSAVIVGRRAFSGRPAGHSSL